MLLVDCLLRYSTVTLALLLVGLLARDGRQYLTVRIAIATLITFIAFALFSAPTELKLPYPLYGVALVIEIPSVCLTWWLSMALLNNHFKLGTKEWVIMVVACSFKLGWALHGMGIYLPAHTFRWWGSYVFGIGLSVHIVWVALSGLRDDLISARRQVRIWLVLIITFAGVLSTLQEMGDAPINIESLIALGIRLPILTWVFFLLTQSSPHKFLFEPTARKRINEAIDFKDMAMYQRLTQVMEIEAVYTEYGLSIRSLAEKIDVPEHRLRILINQSMGYRNFSEFLNQYRIAKVKVMLVDPAQARLPILNIATEAGFQTLSTFNRAFKLLEGETPTEFRKRSLSKQVLTTD